MDSCFGLVGPHQHVLAYHQVKILNYGFLVLTAIFSGLTGDQAREWREWTWMEVIAWFLLMHHRKYCGRMPLPLTSQPGTAQNIFQF